MALASSPRPMRPGARASTQAARCGRSAISTRARSPPSSRRSRRTRPRRARAAALVDSRGETVDYAGRAGALRRARGRRPLAHRSRRGERRARPSAKCAGSRCAPREPATSCTSCPRVTPWSSSARACAGFGGWQRAVASCATPSATRPDGPWRGRARGSRWTVAARRQAPSGVAAHRRRRCAPSRSSEPLQGASPGARGPGASASRAGLEATLVREPGGAWYSDEPVERTPSRPLGRPVRQREQSR